MRNLFSKAMRGFLLTGVLVLAGFLAATPAAAVNMTAAATTLTMPDGGVVTMWGYSINGDPTFGAPFGPNGPPVIRETAGNGLTINLTNNLLVATSLVIPGQNDTTMVPVSFNDPQGRSRAKSFTNETAAGAGGVYTWNNLKAGTYLIHSGSHPGVQVPMGLYAVLIVDEVPGTRAYAPGGINVDYDSDVVLLFSEVDSLQHQAVATGVYGTPAYLTTMAAGYGPNYFLVNGRPWGPGRTALPAGTTADSVLVRFLNAGIRERAPVLLDGQLSVVAEDGNPFNPVGGALQQYSRHSVELSPMKTVDALFTGSFAGYYPIFDRRLGLTNNNSGPGGMLAYLQVDPVVPITHDLTATIAGAGTGTGSVQMTSAPGGIDIGNFVGSGIDGSETLLAGIQVTLTGTPQSGTTSMLTGWSVVDAGGPTGECLDPFGDCVITIDADKTVSATFSIFTQVTVLTPNGGELLPSGSSYTIRWGAPATAVNYTLAYSLGAGSPWQVIATQVTGNKYVWVVPEHLPNSDSIYIAVIAYNAAGSQVGQADISDNPTTATSMALLTPSAGGIVLANGVNYDITWSSSLISGTIAKTALWYQIAPGAPWQFISSLTGDPGTYTWTVPNNPTTQAKVGVIFYDSLANPLHLDVSNNMFEIQ